LSQTFQWLSCSVNDLGLDLEIKSLEPFKWAMDKMYKLQTVAVSSIDDIPVEAAQERYFIEAAGIKSYLIIPLVMDNVLVGLLGFNAEHKPRTWSEEDIRLLKLFGEVFANAIDRKHMEEALHNEKALLERRVEDRTAALTSMNAELQRAIRAKDEFLACMSHELRTPLSAILSVTESLDEEIYGPLTPEQKKALKSVSESGEHLLSLINDILDLSKIEAGKITLDMHPVVVEDICQASMRLSKSQAHKKRLSVTFAADSQASVIMADERHLKQMIVNLLSNAVKFTPDGGRIGLEVTVEPGEESIRFIVWDSGIGIAPEKLPLLFKPFSQLDSSLSRQYGGTGLGLALVARLAELHGGSISVESTPGEGSRFTITLPWEKESCEEPHPYLPDGPPSFRQALVIEDSRGDAERVTRYLDELGVSSVVHMSGSQVVEKAVEINPDIIILDIILPDIDGWQVLSQLKADDRTKDIPVIIVSVIDDHAEGRRMGASDYLVKPVSRERLKRALGKSLRQPGICSRALVISPPVAQASTGPLVLLAEDNETTVANVSDYLKAKGYRLVIAHNGREAVERAAEALPDIILMDVQMPVMDGLEATKLIKADEKLAAIPIIALTALAMIGDRERCLDAGADEYMSKPVSLKELVRVIEGLRNAGTCTR
jgi:signal transduction histidine kinase/CheY-like chemotaxis protein